MARRLTFSNQSFQVLDLRAMPETRAEPTDEDIRYFADLCQVIGFVVIHWSLAEQQLDNWVNVCAHNAGGKPFLDGKGVPQALKRKVTFIKRCLREFPAIAEFRDECTDLLSRFLSASN